jgi:hypothetical protein
MPESAPQDVVQSEPNPLYLDLTADKITVVPALNNNIPISCFSIHRLVVNFLDFNQQGKTIEALVGAISASSFTRGPTGNYIERGLFRSSTAKEYNLRDSEVLSVDSNSQLVVRVTINDK